MEGTGDMIECARGWQAEIQLPGGWVLRSEVKRKESTVKKAAEAIAARLGIDLEWCAAETEGGEG